MAINYAPTRVPCWTLLKFQDETHLDPRISTLFTTLADSKFIKIVEFCTPW